MPIQSVIIRLASGSLFVFSILGFCLHLILNNQRDEPQHVLCLQWKEDREQALGVIDTLKSAGCRVLS